MESKDGKVLQLSLRDYLSLVMSNNLDIAIERLTIVTGEDAILRSFSPFDPKGSASWSSSRSKTPTASLLDVGQVSGTPGSTALSTVSLDTLRQPATSPGASFFLRAAIQRPVLREQTEYQQQFSYLQSVGERGCFRELFPAAAFAIAALTSTGCPSSSPAAICARPGINCATGFCKTSRMPRMPTGMWSWPTPICGCRKKR